MNPILAALGMATDPWWGLEEEVMEGAGVS